MKNMNNSIKLKNNFLLKNFSRFFFIFLLSVLLNSCGLYKKTDSRTNPVNDAEKRKKNIEEGRGFRLSSALKGGNGTFDFASSNPMWRASLKVLDFIPLVNADYGGGIIITDWFSENTADEAIKITIMFSSNEIRADGINVIIHQKKCIKQVCSTSLLENNLNNEIKLAILKKATNYKTADVKKIKKRYGEYPTSKNK